MPRNDVKVTLDNYVENKKGVYSEEGKLTVTTTDTNIELPSIVNKQVPGATLTFRSFKSRGGKAINTYTIRLAGRRNLKLVELVNAIGSYLRGNGDALRKVNVQ